MKAKQEIQINYKRRKKRIRVKKLSFFGMMRGLTFRSRSFSDILYFDFSKMKSNSIHSIFVFYDFYAIYMDEKNNVKEIYKVKPFTPILVPEKSSTKLIEIPINDKNRELIDFFDGKRKV
jgi:uncharacterized membrane protein (UPF0127 family)